MFALSIVILALIWLISDVKTYKRSHLERRIYPLRFGKYKIFTEGIDWIYDFFQKIENSQNEIKIITYIVKNDQLGNNFMELLINRSRSGVKVQIQLDWFGSLLINRRLVKALRASGGKVRFSRTPKLLRLFSTLNTRNHRKIAIIDRKYCYIGGNNIGDEYANNNPRLNPWKDYHLLLKGDITSDFLAFFNDSWHGRKFKETEITNNKAKYGKMQLVIYENGNMHDIYMKYIRCSKVRIIIGSPYFIPDRIIHNELISALSRGVKVQIILPDKKDHPLVHEAARPYLKHLINQKAEIFLVQNGFFHAKFLSIDEKFIEIGSQNFTRRSFNINDEVSCRFTCKEDVTKLIKAIQKDMSEAKLLKISDFPKLKTHEKPAYLLAKLLANYL